jgi:hypothetical protein
MIEQDFKTNMRAAKLFQGLSSETGVSDFWAGYQRGLRRHYHGKKFGTDEEHKKWMSLVKDETRREKGVGYRAGFKGKNIQIAMEFLLIGKKAEKWI